MFYYLIYTISIIFFWGMLLLDALKPGELGMLIALAYSFYSPYVLARLVERETLLLKGIKWLGPTIYMVASTGILLSRGATVIALLLEPIFIAYVLFALHLFEKRPFPRKEIQFFVLMFAYTYAYVGYHYYQKHAPRANVLPNFAQTTATQDSLILAQNTLTLANFQFINQQQDTIQLLPSNQYTILETWNERCPPCLKAIPALKNFYKSLEGKARQHYVYVSPTRQPVNQQQVFAFEPIGAPERILMNINLQQDLNLESYPIFLVFDPKGKLVLVKKGFSKAIQPVLEQAIQGVVL